MAPETIKTRPRYCQKVTLGVFQNDDEVSTCTITRLLFIVF